MLDILLNRHTVIFLAMLAAALVVIGTAVGSAQKPYARRLSVVCIRAGYACFAVSVLLFIRFMVG